MKGQRRKTRAQRRKLPQRDWSVFGLSEFSAAQGLDTLERGGWRHALEVPPGFEPLQSWLRARETLDVATEPRSMAPLRFKVQTMMIVIAAAAVLMGLLRWSPPIFAFLAIIAVEISPFAVYYRFLKTRRRQFSEGQSPVPDIGAGPERAGRKIAGSERADDLGEADASRRVRNLAETRLIS